jgi:hypothetical protein
VSRAARSRRSEAELTEIDSILSIDNLVSVGARVLGFSGDAGQTPRRRASERKVVLRWLAEPGGTTP